MRAIILAAGRGSRMQSQTLDRPKCLVEWQGRALLDWQLQALHDVGIADVAVVTGYLRERLASRGLAEFVNHRWADTTMVDSLVCADQWLRAGPTLVLYSDIVYSPKVLERIIQPYESLTVASFAQWFDLWRRRFVDVLSDAESFRVDDAGLIVEIGSRPESVEDIQGQFMGILQFQPSAWEGFRNAIGEFSQSSESPLDMTGLLGWIVKTNWMPVRAVEVDGAWAEFDLISDIRAADFVSDAFREEFQR